MKKIYYTNNGWVCNRYPYDLEIENENNFIEVDEDTYNKSLSCELGKAWRVANGILSEEIYDNEIYEEHKLNILRLLRDKILQAFDKYRANVIYGIEVETDQEKKDMLAYYRQLLDLDENAINNVHPKLQYYM